jgi:hypothetical protein
MRGYRWEAGRLAAMAESPLGAVTMAQVCAEHISAWRDMRLRSVQSGTVTREMTGAALMRDFDPTLPDNNLDKELAR